MTAPNWKPEIIRLTETDSARERKIDASFFPPVLETTLTAWEKKHGVLLPQTIRGFLLQSDGLEAQRGEIWPVLPLAQWEVIDDACLSPTPWLGLGETVDYRYLLATGDAPSIYRVPRFGSDPEFFAATFGRYLELIFRGDG